MKRQALAILAVLVFIAGCQTPGQKLLVAQNTVTVAQDTWTGMLTNGTVKDRPTIIVGTAAINHASAAVGKAYAAYKLPATQPGNEASTDYWVDFALDAALDAVKTVQQIQSEKAGR